MSQASHLWLRLACIAVLTIVVMAGFVALLISSIMPHRTVPSNPAAQTTTSALDRPSTAPDFANQQRAREPLPIAPAALDAPLPSGNPTSIEPITPPPASAKPPSSETAKTAPLDPPKHWKAGDTFTQEVVVTRLSAYRILGADVGQNVQYIFVSRLTIAKAERDGSMIVKQKIQEARFSKGDPAMQALLNDALKKTKGVDFEFTLDSKGRVTRFQGPKEPRKLFAGNNPLAGQTFLLWSFLDDDAWKELAEITFFQPDKPLERGVKWSRKLTHSWGPLGTWAGQTAYVAAGKQKGMERINYMHEMTYQPPRAAGRELGFKVSKADFRPLAAGGAILVDPEQGTVSVAEETFRVRGALLVTFGDTDAAVEMDETQHFRLRILPATPGR